MPPPKKQSPRHVVRKKNRVQELPHVWDSAFLGGGKNSGPPCTSSPAMAKPAQNGASALHHRSVFHQNSLTLILPLRFSPKYFLTLFSAIRFSQKKSLPIFLMIGSDQLLTGSSGWNLKCVYFKLLYNSCYVFLLLLSYIWLVVKLF